ncbi:MAG: Sua5/YciO/YrdC/YwlC family protein [Betaproteobacteria bacterium]|nr:Sua5/YciO/YrdC/YwlC family protein [Betaproteobacteria bacterium]
MLLARLRHHLRRGGVIAYATESCFGLGCDPRNYRAVQRLLRLKGRPQGKGLILIAGRRAQIEPYIAPLEAAARRQLDRAWPGPVSFLVPAAKRTPRWLTGGSGKIALRVTAHPDAAALCNALGMALVSTSANPAGHRPARTLAECVRMFGQRMLGVPGRVGRRRRPSTIKDLETGRIIRP